MAETRTIYLTDGTTIQVNSALTPSEVQAQLASLVPSMENATYVVETSGAYRYTRPSGGVKGLI